MLIYDSKGCGQQVFSVDIQLPEEEKVGRIAILDEDDPRRSFTEYRAAVESRQRNPQR